MALVDILNLSEKGRKVGISEERIRAVLPALRQYVAFWREYPDLFLDFLSTGGDPNKKKGLNLYYY